MKFQNIPKPTNYPFKIKTELAYYLIFTMLIGVPAIFAAYITLFVDSSFWPAFFTLFLMYAGIMIWFFSFEIIILKDKIIYNGLFSRNNIVKISEIKKLEIKVLHPELLAKNIVYGLNVYDNGKFLKEPLTINLKPFNEKRLAILINRIVFTNPSVKMDRGVSNLRKGYFESITHRVIRKLRKNRRANSNVSANILI